MGKIQKNEKEYIDFFNKKDGLGSLLGSHLISVNKDFCISEYTVSEKHLNPNGILHGGALFTVMDSNQGAYLHFWLDTEYKAAATGTATIKYFAPLKSGKITITSKLASSSGRKFYIGTTAHDEKGYLVASLDEIWIAIF